MIPRYCANSITVQDSLQKVPSAPGEGMLAIIDPGIDRYPMLAEGAIAGAEVLLLEPMRDGIEQIHNYLEILPEGQTLSSLHI
ncbi:MAG: DUF4347 domain-containing protein, partial [Spirulina sp.]